jgi:hypothetical protein
MLSKILLGVILSMGVTFYLFYTFVHLPLVGEVQQQQAVIAAQELRQQEQIKTIEALENNLAKTTEALNVMGARNSEIESEMNRYLGIFKRHNLGKLAAAKPGLIEPRINKGTKDVFDQIESDSTFIDDLDK